MPLGYVATKVKKNSETERERVFLIILLWLLDFESIEMK